MSLLSKYKCSPIWPLGFWFGGRTEAALELHIITITQTNWLIIIKAAAKWGCFENGGNTVAAICSNIASIARTNATRWRNRLSVTLFAANQLATELEESPYLEQWPWRLQSLGQFPPPEKLIKIWLVHSVFEVIYWNGGGAIVNHEYGKWYCIRRSNLLQTSTRLRSIDPVGAVQA